MFFRYVRSLKINTNVNRSYILSFFIILLSLAIQSNLSAQSNDDCLMCHSDDTMTMERGGKEVSIFVDAKVLAKSPHKNLSCVSCHVGFDPDEMPHKEKIDPVSCVSCHNNAPVQHPFHPQILETHGKGTIPGESCKDCHGTHNIISPQQKGSPFYKDNIVDGCGRCHKVEKEKFLQSAHYH